MGRPLLWAEKLVVRGNAVGRVLSEHELVVTATRRVGVRRWRRRPAYASSEWSLTGFPHRPDEAPYLLTAGSRCAQMSGSSAP